MKRVLAIGLFLWIGLTTVAYAKDEPKVKLEVSIHPEEGWMNGGYGSINFKFTNNAGVKVSTGTITGEWLVKGERYNKWDYNPNLQLAAGEEKKGNLIAWMPPKTQKLAGESTPKITGQAKVMVGDEELEIPFSIDVPVAQLPTPLKSHDGKFVAVVLQEKTWKELKNPQKIANYIDDFYAQMLDLTGNRPFNGERMALKESPRNPYFAYAGNPIILNTAFVLNSAKSFDGDQVDFGWVHEMGHDFDNGIGQYYNYGTFTEFQANIKLSYAIENLCTKNSTLKIKSWVDKKTLLTGEAFNDEYFAGAADNYLANASRSWESLSSDEYHAMFHLVIRRYGWKVMKKYYRTFAKLRDKKVEVLNGVDKIFLTLAVLDNCCKGDLVPIYQKWRIPVDGKKLQVIERKYDL